MSPADEVITLLVAGGTLFVNVALVTTAFRALLGRVRVGRIRRVPAWLTFAGLCLLPVLLPGLFAAALMGFDALFGTALLPERFALTVLALGVLTVVIAVIASIGFAVALAFTAVPTIPPHVEDE